MVRQYESHADPVLASLHRPDVGYVVFEDGSSLSRLLTDAPAAEGLRFEAADGV
jgi:hypothetical protein